MQAFGSKSTTMASTVEMTVNTTEPEHHQGEKAKDAEDTKVNVWDTESDISKNPKSISWYVIFASALANFSDGYQNNLVSIIFTPNRINTNAKITVIKHQCDLQTHPRKSLHLLHPDQNIQCIAGWSCDWYCCFRLYLRYLESTRRPVGNFFSGCGG